MAQASKPPAKKRPPIIRKESPAQPEEMPKLSSAFSWFNSVVNNERFHIVMDHLMRLKRFKPGELQAEPHQQFIASGYDIGYNDLRDRMYEVAANPPSPQELEEFQEMTRAEADKALYRDETV